MRCSALILVVACSIVSLMSGASGGIATIVSGGGTAAGGDGVLGNVLESIGTIVGNIPVLDILNYLVNSLRNALNQCIKFVEENAENRNPADLKRILKSVEEILEGFLKSIKLNADDENLMRALITAGHKAVESNDIDGGIEALMDFFASFLNIFRAAAVEPNVINNVSDADILNFALNLEYLEATFSIGGFVNE